jgi:prepilin-type N-terminal cleavage/methylation domain-containing protein
MNTRVRQNRGFSIIEVMVAFAVMALTLAFTLPSAIDQKIRDRVETTLEQASSAKQALLRTCDLDAKATVNSNFDAGYFYIPTGSDEDYMGRIALGADCANDSMKIVIWTSHTGAPTDPVLELTADRPDDSTAWTCRVIVGDLRHVPKVCQLSYQAG